MTRPRPPLLSRLAATRVPAIAILLLLATIGATCKSGRPGPKPYPGVFPQPGQVFQQIGGLGDIVVEGFYSGSPAWIEARWDDGPWTVVDAAPQGGVFAGVLPAQSIGWGLLQVRDSAELLLYSIPFVGVGDVYVIAGQSNAVMKTETQRSAVELSTTLPLTAPAGSTLFKWTDDPLHRHDDATGSVWPLLADRVTGASGIPVMFVATGSSNSGLVSPPNWAPGAFLYDRMVSNTSVATASSMEITAVLWFQGETDASNGVTALAYETGLCDFAQSLQPLMGLATPVIAARLGPNAGVAASATEAIRAGQTAAIANCADVWAGPITEDLPVLPDGVHFGDAVIPDLLERWCDALQPLYAADLGCLP